MTAEQSDLQAIGVRPLGEQPLAFRMDDVELSFRLEVGGGIWMLRGKPSMGAFFWVTAICPSCLRGVVSARCPCGAYNLKNVSSIHNKTLTALNAGYSQPMFDVDEVNAVVAASLTLAHPDGIDSLARDMLAEEVTNVLRTANANVITWLLTENVPNTARLLELADEAQATAKALGLPW